jgi:hypothetical protein
LKGASASVTVTGKLAVVKFPAASVVLKVLTVVPTGKTDPLGKPAVCIVVGVEQLSVPMGAEYETVAPHSPGVLLTIIAAGTDKFGLTLSITETITGKVN